MARGPKEFATKNSGMYTHKKATHSSLRMSSSICQHGPATVYKWPPPNGVFELSVYQPPNIGVDLKNIEFKSMDDPVVFFKYDDDQAIHATCGAHGGPVAQAVNAAATAANVKAWVHNGIVQISGPGCTVPPGNGVGASRVVYQCLTTHELFHFLVRLTGNCMLPGLSYGSMYVATPTGKQRSPQAMKVPHPGFCR